MMADGLTEDDVEESVLNGQIVRVQTDHLGRRRYTIEGTAAGGRRVRTVCRYSDAGDRIVMITVYEVGEE